MFVNKDFFVGINDCDLNLDITNYSLLKYLEEIAGIHSSIVGYGLYNDKDTKRTWIALGWKVNIIRRPKYLETMNIKTWVRDESKLYSFRDFEIKDEKDNLIIKATSKWVMVDIDSRNILRLNSEIINSYKPENISIFDRKEDFKFLEPENKKEIYKYAVDDSFIDYNKHVHNLDYIKLANKAYPDSEKYNNFEIMYKKEIKLNDSIKLYLSELDNMKIIVIKSLDDKILHSIIKFYNN